MNYKEFLHTKIEVAPESGFDVRPEDIHPALKPHQRDAVVWALKGGRRALFESFGLGKTIQELEWCRQVQIHEQGPVLIVLPLGVRQEFTRDAVDLLGIAPPVYITHMAQVGLNVYANGVTIQRWIPVTERLPKEDDVDVAGCILAIERSDGFARRWEMDAVQRSPEYFTHWMPLPKAPGKEGA